MCPFAQVSTALCPAWTVWSITKSTCSHARPQHPGPSCVPRRSGLWQRPASCWALTLGSPTGHGDLGTAQLTGLQRHPSDVCTCFLLTSQASSPVLGSELTPPARGLAGPRPAQSCPSGCVPSPVPVATQGPCPGPVPSLLVPPPLSGATPPASPQADVAAHTGHWPPDPRRHTASSQAPELGWDPLGQWQRGWGRLGWSKPPLTIP